jgi:hypothetical protein
MKERPLYSNGKCSLTGRRMPGVHLRPHRIGARRDEKGQALLVVMGLVTLIFFGTLAVAQNVSQHFPIVERDAIVHEAYRAMQAGINNYLSMTNSNPDTVICGATVTLVNKYPNPTSSSSSQPSIPSGSQLCSGFTAGSWVKVPNLASVQGPDAWYLYGAPTIYYCNDPTNPSGCPTTVWVSIKVIGASKAGSIISYTPGTVTFQPENGFLLNLWWLNYDQLDPTTLAGTQTCTWYWNNGNSLESGCKPVDFVDDESLTGNIFSNDPIFICSGSDGGPTVTGTVATHDSQVFVTDPTGGGCGNSVKGTHTPEPNQPFEQIPTDDVVIGNEAAANGCLYEGPTEIQLAESGSTWGMDVTSPDTPTGGPGTTNDALDDLSNASTCVPSSNGGFVPYPKNGVVFVENCTSSDAQCTITNPFNPLGQGGNDLYAPDDSESGWQGPSATSTSNSQLDGDVLVQGTESGPLTIAAQNNVVITGDLCYASWGTTTGPPSVPCDAPPSNAYSDVLGLIAYNYVVVNQPMKYSGGNWSKEPGCSSNLATFGSTTSNSGLDCDLQNPVIDAAILTLNEQFFVSNWDCPDSQNPTCSGATGGNGNIYVNGSISENWRGPVGTTAGTGYSKQYTYDQRLEYLSPPDYLNPGTASWTLGTISGVTGSCPSSITGCSTIP